MTMKIVDSIALFGTYCIYHQMYNDLIVMRCVLKNKQLIYVAKTRAIHVSKKYFQTDDMEMTYGYAKRYHNLCMNYANGILFIL